MKKTITSIRVFFFLLCVLGSLFLWIVNSNAWSGRMMFTVSVGASLGALVILIDVMLRGFSLRGLTALSFGLAVGGLISWFIASSPLFRPMYQLYPENVYMVELCLYLFSMYLCTVIALRGKDEFHLVIPYMRFVSEDVETPVAVLDEAILMDGRIEKICREKWMTYALVVPRFVINDLHTAADSSDGVRRERGRKGLNTLNALLEMEHLNIRVEESEIKAGENLDSKVVFLAASLKGKVLTTDYNLAQMARVHRVDWLNLTALVKSLNPEMVIGDTLEIELVKKGKDEGQAVGFLHDGSMVVVRDGLRHIGSVMTVAVESIIPSSGGKMIFAKII